MSVTLVAEGEMPKGLIRRAGRYSLRKVVPLDLQAAYGRREIVKALGTSDPQEARYRYAQVLVQLEADFRAQRQARSRGAATAAPTKRSDPHPATLEAQVAEMDRTIVGRLEQARLNEEVQEEFDFLHDWYTLAQDMIQGRRQATLPMSEVIVQRDILRSRLTGDATATMQLLKSKLLDVAVPFEPLLVDILPRWKGGRSLASKTYARAELWAAKLDGIRSRSKSPSLTREHVQIFLREMRDQGQKPENINSIINLLKAACNVAVQEGLYKENPLSRLHLTETKRAIEKRRPFSPAELNKLFSGPVHLKNARPAAGAGEAAFWLPILALYTGGRLTELGQLYVDDVYEEESGHAEELVSATVIRFTANKVRGQSLKTATSERRVPVHSILTKLGFLDFVERTRSSGNSRLFPEIQPSATGELMGSWTKWFTRYRRHIGLIGQGVAFHSLRHNFKSNCRSSKIETEIHNALTGHVTGDVADTYGPVSFPLDRLVDAIRAYHVPGLKLLELLDPTFSDVAQPK